MMVSTSPYVKSVETPSLSRISSTLALSSEIFTFPLTISSWTFSRTFSSTTLRASMILSTAFIRACFNFSLIFSMISSISRFIKGSSAPTEIPSFSRSSITFCLSSAIFTSPLVINSLTFSRTTPSATFKVSKILSTAFNRACLSFSLIASIMVSTSPYVTPTLCPSLSRSAMIFSLSSSIFTFPLTTRSLTFCLNFSSATSRASRILSVAFCTAFFSFSLILSKISSILSLMSINSSS